MYSVPYRPHYVCFNEVYCDNVIILPWFIVLTKKPNNFNTNILTGISQLWSNGEDKSMYVGLVLFYQGC